MNQNLKNIIDYIKAWYNYYTKTRQFLMLIIIGCTLGGMIAMFGTVLFNWTITTALLWQFGMTLLVPFIVPLIAALILGIGILTGKIL